LSRIHQATGAVGPFDAVTGQLTAYRDLFARWGVAGDLYAALIAPGAPAGVRPLERLRPAPDDLVVVHYAGWVAGMQQLREIPARTLLVYHNVTSARWFWRFEPRMGLSCTLGRERLPAFVRAMDAAAGVSEFNAAELRAAGARDPAVVHILIEPERLPPAPAAPRPVEDNPLVISIGRVTPHKRPDLAIRAFALYQRRHRPDARLLFGGQPLNDAYRGRLERLIDDVGARNVQLGAGLPDAALRAAYAEASAFVLLSEHEGFCVPLLEAMASGVPAVARPAAAMPEVGGDAVLWAEDGDPALAAELLHLATSDDELRRTLFERGVARAADFSYDRVAERIRAATEAVR